MSQRLLGFSRELLELAGAATQTLPHDQLEVLFPDEDTAQQFAAPPEAKLSFGAEASPDAIAISLEASWLDRCRSFLDTHGARIELQLPDYPSPRIKAQSLLEGKLDLPNATFRTAGVEACYTRYVVVLARFQAVSEDRRDGVISIGFNVGTQAPIGSALGPLTQAVDDQWAQWAQGARNDPGPLSQRGAVPAPPDTTVLRDIVQRAIAPRVREQLAPFMAGLQRRLERDAERLFEFHKRLLDECRSKVAKHKRSASPDREKIKQAIARERARASAIQREYASAIEDLRGKYQVEVEITPVRVLDIIAPVQRIAIDILRRKSKKRVHLDIGVHGRSLEPLACDDDWGHGFRRWACDERVHLLSDAGFAPCPSCDKRYCRVCAPSGCPRCRRS